MRLVMQAFVIDAGYYADYGNMKTKKALSGKSVNDDVLLPCLLATGYVIVKAGDMSMMMSWAWHRRKKTTPWRINNNLMKQPQCGIDGGDDINNCCVFNYQQTENRYSP